MRKQAEDEEKQEEEDRRKKKAERKRKEAKRDAAIRDQEDWLPYHLVDCWAAWVVSVEQGKPEKRTVEAEVLLEGQDPGELLSTRIKTKTMTTKRRRWRRKQRQRRRQRR